ncbi:hypothetical protein ABIA16_001721 [Sinorhizobium fredii]
MTNHRAAIDTFNAAAAKSQAVSSSTIRTAFLDQHVDLRLSDDDIGVVLDAHGCDVFTVDVNNGRPDEEALTVAALIVEFVNDLAGFSGEKAQ